MKRILALIAILAVAHVSAQNTGSIVGNITDKEMNNDPLPFANVLIKGTTKGTTTDFDGLYRIENLEPGSYTLVFSFVGYETVEISDIIVEGDKATTVDTAMGAGKAAQLEEVVVTTTVKRESEVALQLEQKKAAEIQTKIGAQELSRKGASDVATGLTKASGISRASDKLYVRGLGDRYNNAYLNGLPIPSLNPKLKLIDLGIFPTKIVENLGIYKAYSAELYGDFAGASVDIDTKDNPGSGFLEVGVSTGANSNALSNDFFLLNGGKYDFFGIEDGSRNVPAFVNIPNYNYVSTDIDFYPFDTSFNPEKRFNAPDGGANIIGGKSFQISETRRLDFLVSASFGQNHNTALNGIEAAYNSQGEPIGFGRFENVSRYQYSTNTTILGSIGYRWNNNNKIVATTLFVNDTQDELRSFVDGVGGEDTDVKIRLRRGTFEQNNLFTQQLTGEHKFNDRKYVLNWGAAYNKALGYTPDRRQLFFTELQNGNLVFGNRVSPDLANNQRFYQVLNEEDISGKFSMDINFDKDDTEAYQSKFTMGVDVRAKNRNFEADQLNYNLNGFINENVDFNNPDEFLNEGNFLNGLYVVQENLNPTRIYKADFKNFASFAVVQKKLGDKLTLNAGARLENFEQNVFYRQIEDLETSPFRSETINELFVLPSISFKYELNENANLRFAASKTVTLPKFTEVAPFLDEDVTEATLGNPIVTNSDNYNLDIKWEYFPESTGEAFAATLFGKYIENPIEKVYVASASNQNTFINSESAKVYGVEIEAKKNIGSLLGAAENNVWSVGLNATLMKTEVEIDPNTVTFNGSNIAPTNNNRRLQGASPFIINADISYSKEMKNHKLSSTLDFNVFGDRIYSAGGNGVGDIFERGYGTLNFNFKDEIGKHWELGLSAKNLLDPSIERFQDQADRGEEYITYDFNIGINFSLGVTYKF
ncbi:TonB-dependent receptor domain-containing protein [Sungkyunkwania multivorans]|uniref:TonB-dependent receptor domain-containing protein n=1 Tax=Sungkyunkwania multivorans TaxID=1173618 RepID=A0ABW3CV36_9FLAO